MTATRHSDLGEAFEDFLAINPADKDKLEQSAKQLNKNALYSTLYKVCRYTTQHKGTQTVRSLTQVGTIPIDEIPLIAVAAFLAPSEAHISTLMSTFNETGESFTRSGYLHLVLIFYHSHINKQNIFNLEKVKNYIFDDVENVLAPLYIELYMSGSSEMKVFWEYYKQHTTTEINAKFLKLIESYATKNNEISMLEDFYRCVNSESIDPILMIALTYHRPSTLESYVPQDGHIKDPGGLYELAVKQDSQYSNTHQRLLERYVGIWKYLFENGDKYKDLNDPIIRQYNRIFDHINDLSEPKKTICVYLIRIMIRTSNPNDTRITNLIKRLNKQEPILLKDTGKVLLADAIKYGKPTLRDFIRKLMIDAEIKTNSAPRGHSADITHYESIIMATLSNLTTMRGINTIEHLKRDVKIFAALSRILLEPTSTKPSEDDAALNAEWKKYLIGYNSPAASILLDILSERTPSSHPIRFFDYTNVAQTQPTAAASSSSSPSPSIIHQHN